MTRRLQYNFFDLSKLPLPGSTLAQMMAEAAFEARLPSRTEQDCPFGHSRDPVIRACRLTWRATFRRMRQRCRPPCVTSVSSQSSKNKDLAA